MFIIELYVSFNHISLPFLLFMHVLYLGSFLAMITIVWADKDVGEDTPLLDSRMGFSIVVYVLCFDYRWNFLLTLS